jgi:chromosome segregation ATPase
MTPDDTASLMEFLATQFARMDGSFAAIDARLTAIETRLTRIEARQDSMEARLDRVEARLDRVEVRLDGMEARLDGMEARLDRIEVRLTRVEVLHEDIRTELRRVAEGVVSLSERLDREVRAIHVRFDRFEVDFGTVQMDHEIRLTALEQHRRRRGPRG